MIEKIKYPDGSFYTKVTEFKPEITFRLNSYEDLWQLAQIKDVYDHNKQELSVIIPNLLDAQADRRFDENESTNLKMVCDFINKLNFKSVSVFHPHNAEVVEALINNVKIIDNSDYIYEVLAELKSNYDFNAYDMEANLILMSSDAGGFKPLMKLCDKLEWKGETYSASKSRDKETHKLTQLVDRQDFEGKDILIIDDICVNGGTFKGLSKMLESRNCGKLYLAVSHFTVQDLGRDPVTEYFDKVFTTNSKNYYYCVTRSSKYPYEAKPDNLEVIEVFK
jgi:ribose-phosphate pyrophosphokinase